MSLRKDDGRVHILPEYKKQNKRNVEVSITTKRRARLLFIKVTKSSRLMGYLSWRPKRNNKINIISNLRRLRFLKRSVTRLVFRYRI